MFSNLLAVNRLPALVIELSNVAENGRIRSRDAAL
jgi:hypothetical protein